MCRQLDTIHNAQSRRGNLSHDENASGVVARRGHPRCPSASAARADLENENLLVTAPPGYKVGFSDKKPNMLMTEFVPAKETVENWTEMVTVQVFFGLKATPQQFMDDMGKLARGVPGGRGSAHGR